MSENVGYATLSVIPSARGFGAKLQAAAGAEVDKASKPLSHRLSEGLLGGFAGGFAAGALERAGESIKEFVTGAVDTFSEVEDATGAAGVVFGKSVSDITKFADGAASKFGLAQGLALNSALTFGTLGKAAGKTGKDLSGFATQFAGLSGDLASFRGTSTEQAVEAVGAALRGEMEPIRAYGVLLDDATLRSQALKMGLIKTTKEALTPQNKTLAAAAAILAQTKDAQGDFARTSQSTANTQKALQAATENAQAALGKKLAPALTFARRAGLGLIVGLTGIFSGLESVVRVGANVVGFLQDHSTASIAVAGIITAVLLPVILVLGSQLVWLGTQAVISAAKQVVSWVTTSASAVASGAAQLVACYRVVGGWILMGAQSLLAAGRMAAAWFIALGPIGWVIAAVIAIVALVIANWDKVSAWTQKAWGAVTSWVSQAWDSITSTLGGIASTIGGWISTVGQIMTSFIMAVTFPMRLAMAIGVTLILAGWNAIKGYVFAAVGFVVGIVKTGFNLYVAVIRGALNIALSVVRAVWGAISAAFRWGAGIVGSIVRAAMNVVRSAFGGLVAIVNVVSGIFGRVVSAVSSKIGQVVSYAKGIGGRVLGAIGDFGSLLYHKGADIVSGLINGIGSMGSRLAGFVKQFIADHIPAPVAKALKIASPSRVMAALAKWIPLGLVKGIDSTAPVLDRRMENLVKDPKLPALKPTDFATAPGAHGSGPSLDVDQHFYGITDPEEAAAASVNRLEFARNSR